MNKHWKRNCKNSSQIMVCTSKSNRTTTKQQSKHKNPCKSRELNPEPLAPPSDRYFGKTELTVRIDYSQAI